MATTSPTGRVFPLPDLVGVKAAQAIEQLRELGLTPVPLPSVVADVAEAGFVLGLDPPPSAMVRPKTRITLSVATHPDFDGRAEASLDQLPSVPVQPPLGWPHSAPAGLATPEPEFDPRDLGALTETAAVPHAQSAPAPAVADVAFAEPPHDGSSSAAIPSDSAAPPFFDEFTASVPTPDEYAAQDEWDRIRAEQSAQHSRQHGDTDDVSAALDFDDAQPVVHGELVDVAHQRAEDDQRRREARRRARKYRRLTFKQKAVVGTVLLSTLLLVLAAASGHKRPARATTVHHTARKRSLHTKTPRHARPATKSLAVRKKKHAAKPKTRIVVRTRTRTRVVTVTVPTSTAPTSSLTNSATTTPASSYTPPAQPAVTHTVAQTPPARTSTTTSSKPASARTSTDSSSSGTRGGSTLQSPDGAIAPPKPTQP